MTSPSRITLALVEDDLPTRERLLRVIAADPLLDLRYVATGVSDMRDGLAQHAIQVLLVDLGLPDGSGIEVINACRRLQPACEIMVLTMFADEANMLKAFEAGARGYLLKDGTEADLAEHVRQLHVGGSPMSPLIARRLLMQWSGRQAPAALPAHQDGQVAGETTRPLTVLTAKEFQVLDLTARGFTYAEIGQQMGVSVNTVQTHVRNMYAKLDVHNKAEALFEARQLGWLR